jgi:Flp pilus assembly protein TadD
MRGRLQFRLAGTLVACACALGSVTAWAQGSYSPYNESPSAAMARYIRDLASDPKDFDSLIGAGRAALALGDPQAAAGFFARADEVNPRSPLPEAGMGAVSVANGEPQAAFPYFKRAEQLGAPVASFACDRGLAYDLLGQQAQAQADYRLALNGRDSDEARKRLALSLAISGDRSNALQALAPLSAKGEPGVARVRAFVLALTGDPNAAMSAVNAAMPGSGSDVAPFLQRLAALSAGQKAAAVNLGIFPEGNTSYAAAAPSRPSTSMAMAGNERLAGIDAVLRPAPAPAQPAAQAAPPAWQVPQSVRVAYAPQPAPALVQRSVALFQPKLWLQLSSGQNVDVLASRFRHYKAQNPDVFQGIKPYVARSGDGVRLLVGPFHGPSDAATFAADLETLGIDAYKFTDSPADRIAPLLVE